MLPKNEEAIFKLVRAYRGHAVILSKELLENYFYRDLVQLDDMVAIGLVAVVNAFEKYNKELGTFYSYWKAIAKNDMIHYLNKNIKFFDSLYVSDSDSHHFMCEDEKYPSLEEEIRAYLNDGKNRISRSNRKIFTLYLDGASAEEIATKCKISINTVWSVINRTKKKIRVYLNSIDY